MPLEQESLLVEDPFQILDARTIKHEVEVLDRLAIGDLQIGLVVVHVQILLLHLILQLLDSEVQHLHKVLHVGAQIL